MQRLTKFLLVICVLLLAIGINSKRVDLVNAGWPTHCWQDGCCAPSRVYNQWSCQQQEGLCRYWQVGQVEEWTCPTTGTTYGTSSAGQSNCNNACPDPVQCELMCADGWASTCQIIQGDQPCDYPDAGTCTAEIPSVACTSQNGGSSCSVSTGGSQTTGCWVNGPPSNPDPSPNNTPTTCFRCLNQQACAETTSTEPCGCSGCTSQTSRKVIVMFEDSNENGLWEHYAPYNEKRISNTSSCNGTYTIVVPGAAFTIDNELHSTHSCDKGLDEYTEQACSSNQTQCYNNAVSPPSTGSQCSPWGAQSNGNNMLAIEKTCLDEATCSSWNPTCEFTGGCNRETATGVLCPGYCNSGSTNNLRSGPISIVAEDTGSHAVGVVAPAGWRKSNFNPQTANWTNTNGACDGITALGLVRDTEKWCQVTPVDSYIGTTTNNTLSMNVRGYSANPNESVAVTITRKSPGLSTIISPQPNNTTLATFGPRYYYYVNNISCTAGNGQTCDDQFTVSGLPVGEYYVYCSMNTANPVRCTGNPNCIHEGLGGTINCSPDISCENGVPDDNATITVTCTPSCPVACGQPNGCSGNCGTTSTGAPPMPVPMSSRDITVNVANPNQHTASLTWQAGAPTPTSGPTSRYEIVIAPQSSNFDAATALNAFNYCALPIISGGCGSNFTGTCDKVYNGTPIRCVRHTDLITLAHTYLPNVNLTNKIRLFARAVNVSCSAYNLNYQSPFSAGFNYNLIQNISGSFYNDGSVTGIQVCLPSTADPTEMSLPGNSSVTISPPAPTAPQQQTVGGTPATGYSAVNLPYSPATWGGAKSSVLLTLDNSNTTPDARLVCSCPQGCLYDANINTPQTDVSFYITTVDLSTGSWWQAVNGLVYAALEKVETIIPDECIADGVNCIPYLITQDKMQQNNNVKLSAGIPMSGLGVFSSGTGIYLTERDPQARTSPEGTTHTQLIKEDFAHFQSKVNYAAIPNLPVDNSGVITDLPAATPGTVQVYKHTSGNLTVRPGSTWQIQPTVSYVVFVEGNITFEGSYNIDDPLIAVEEGGFISFISTGDIIFDENVGNATPAHLTAIEPSVAGVFVADGSIIVEALGATTPGDKHFIGAGTFVAWDTTGGILLKGRNYDDGSMGGLLNKEYPTETFIYRPDFARNLPEEMKSKDIFWQEVNNVIP